MSSRTSLKLVILHFYFTAHASQDFVYPFVCVLHHDSPVHLLMLLCVCVWHVITFCTHYLLFGFFPHEEFFLPFSGFLLSMGFSPGLCRATTDLNQLLYVWQSIRPSLLNNELFLKNSYTLFCCASLCVFVPSYKPCHNNFNALEHVAVGITVLQILCQN